MDDIDVAQLLPRLIRAAEARATGSLMPVGDVGQVGAPVLVAIGGLAGTGKSTLARGLSSLIGRPPGALHVRSDEIRKILAGVDMLDRLPPDSYTPEASRQVYDLIGGILRAALGAGWSVVVDTVAARPSERVAFAEIAVSCGAGFIGFWLAAPEAMLISRVTARRKDASDADASVVRTQGTYDIGDIDWIRVDASGSAAETLAAVRQAIGL